MSSPYRKPLTLLACVYFLGGCNSAPWPDAAKFEENINCQISLEKVKIVGEEFEMKIKEIPGNTVALFLFKGNTAYSMGFRDGKLLFLQKQGFRTWVPGGFKETISHESVLRCS